MNFLDLAHGNDGVTTITLRNPKVNSLRVELLEELAEVASKIATAADDTRVVVVAGTPKFFAAGAEITQFAADPDPASFRIGTPEQIDRIADAFLAALNAVAAIPVPTIASVSGYALGGGCELALACDLRFAATSAKFGQPEILLGIVPGGGGTQRLARLVGPAVAKDLIFTGRTIDAAEAYRIGLVNEVVEPEELETFVASRAAQLAAGPTGALRDAKRAIDDGLAIDLAAGLELESAIFRAGFTSWEASVGVSSFLRSGPGAADFSGAD